MVEMNGNDLDRLWETLLLTKINLTEFKKAIYPVVFINVTNLTIKDRKFPNW
jgi:hypothetical protein